MFLHTLACSLLAIATLPACARPGAGARDGATPPVVAGYLASWNTGTRGERIAALDPSHLTHVIYAFARVDADGRVSLGDPCADIGECPPGDTLRAGSGGNFARLRALKARAPGLRVLVAIGGWTGSAHFSDAALTEDSRRRFAETAIAALIRPHRGLVDGLDIDWEYPVRGGLPENVRRPEDRENFTRLVAELRRQLDAEGARDGRRYLLTAATSAGPDAVTSLELPRLAQLLDWFNVMTYDYHTGGQRAHFNAPLHAAPGDPAPDANVHASIERYLGAGVPAGRIVLGIPFFGKAYRVRTAERDGLFQPADSASVQPFGAGGLTWRAIAQALPRSPRLVRRWQPDARVPWLFDAASRTWITYDDPQSVREKAAYARRRGLRGVMAWELGGDDGTLTRVMAAAVRE